MINVAENSELVIGFLAAAKSQGIAVPIIFELTEENINAILNSISPRYIIAHSQFFRPCLGLSCIIYKYRS